MHAKIALDIDGVICDFNTAYAKLLAEENGFQLLPEGWKTDPEWPPHWDWDQYYGYPPEIIVKVWTNRILANPHFWERLDPLPDAVEVIKRLNYMAKAGTEVCFISNRMGVIAKGQTEAWLYDKGFDYPTVLLASDKVPLIRSLGLNFYIDDKLDTMLELVRTAEKEKWLGDQHFYLKSAGYNKDGRIPELKVVGSVKEALQEAGLWR